MKGKTELVRTSPTLPQIHVKTVARRISIAHSAFSSERRMRLTGHARLVVRLGTFARRLPLCAPRGQLVPKLVDPGLVSLVDRDQALGTDVAVDALRVTEERLHRGEGRVLAELAQGSEIVRDGSADLLVRVGDICRVHLEVRRRPR